MGSRGSWLLALGLALACGTDDAPLEEPTTDVWISIASARNACADYELSHAL